MVGKGYSPEELEEIRQKEIQDELQKQMLIE